MQVGADGGLPGPLLAEGIALLDDPAGQAQQQRPGQLDGRGRRTRRTADGDTVRLRGRVVDDGIAHAGGDEQLEPGQAGDQGRREGDPLAQGDHDVGVGEGVGQGVLVGEVVGVGDDVDPVRER